MKQKTDDMLVNVQRKFRDRNIKYIHRNKETFQVEISKKTIERNNGVPQHYELKSQTKYVKRFWISDIMQVAQEYETAKEHLDSILEDVTRQMFEKFCQHYAKWMQGLVIVCLCLFCVVCLFLFNPFILQLFTMKQY